MEYIYFPFDEYLTSLDILKGPHINGTAFGINSSPLVQGVQGNALWLNGNSQYLTLGNMR